MKARTWYSVQNAVAAAGGPAEIRIYDDIGMFGVTAADFVRDIAAITASDVTVRINSYGGDVFEGIAILNAIRGMAAKTTVVVDGIAASIASVIAMGGDRVVMNQNSQMMIHNAWNVACGNADELQRVVDGLRSMSSNMATIYAAKAGGTPEEWQALMDAETWYTADEAVAAGLADEVIASASKTDQFAFARSDRAAASLRHFKYRGREAAPAPQIAPRAQTPHPSEAGVTPERKDPTVATLNKRVAEILGLEADASEDVIKGAISALIKLRDSKKAYTAPAVPPRDFQNHTATTVDPDLASAYAKIVGRPIDKASASHPRTAPRVPQPAAQASGSDDYGMSYEEIAWRLNLSQTPPPEVAARVKDNRDPNEGWQIRDGQWVNLTTEREIAELDTQIAARNAQSAEFTEHVHAMNKVKPWEWKPGQGAVR